MNSNKNINNSNVIRTINEESKVFIPKSKHDDNVPKELKSLTTSSRTMELVPPDGGWGWIVVVGCFICMVIATFPLLSFSILFSPLLMTSGVSSTTVAWIYNVYGLIWSLFCPFIGPLCEEYGWRKILILGGVANFLSIFISAFVLKAELLFLTFSVFGGIGGSIGFSVGNLAVSRYFLKKRGFALAILSVGAAVSSFFGPIIVTYLIDFYGYLGATIICAAFTLNQCVGGALVQPVEWHMKKSKTLSLTAEVNLEEKLLNEISGSDDAEHSLMKENKFVNNNKPNVKFDISSRTDVKENAVIDRLSNSKDNDIKNNSRQKSAVSQFKIILKQTYVSLTSLKFLRVKFIAVGHACLLLGFHNFQMWIPFVITNAGYSIEMGAWCMSIGSIANIVGRISISILSDRKWFNVRYVYMFGLLLIGISSIVFAYAKTIGLFMTCVCGWGLGVGISVSLHANVTILVMGVEIFPSILGVSSLFKGLISIVYGPLVGLTRDATSSYTYAILLLGVAEFIGFLLWLLMPLAAKYDQKNMKTAKEPK